VQKFCVAPSQPVAGERADAVVSANAVTVVQAWPVPQVPLTSTQSVSIVPEAPAVAAMQLFVAPAIEAPFLDQA